MYKGKEATSVTLTEDDLREILRSWGVTSFEYQKISRGESTQNWLVESTNARYVLRNAGSDAAHVNMQNLVLRSLRGHGFPYAVPEPLVTDARPYVEFGGSLYMLYHFIDGEPPPSGFDEVLSEEMGALVAAYGKAASAVVYSPLATRHKSLFDTRLITESLLASARLTTDKSDFVNDYFLRSLDGILKVYGDVSAEEVARIKSLERVPCHCDFSAENVLLTGGKITGLIDFGGVSVEPRIFDFQNALVNVAGVSGRVDYSRMRPFTRGYSLIRLLPESESDLVYPLMVADLTLTLAWIFEQRRSAECQVKDSEAVFRISLLNWLARHRREFAERLSHFVK
ncbi:MAG TPA: phosphotransferase [Pyrinomonadaceae bacterium]